ncbi:phosphopantetheine-binding protein [Spongiactinospora gelatinilytica]|uniref:phosphopantetheine-binding protein n=1 Tax=Spongiactinospora gelatinilytica TaxID=2666298 RepID=UPI0034D1F06E
MEHRIAAIFTDLLGVPSIAPDAGFLELGGHSLLATQFVSQVRQFCGVELSRAPSWRTRRFAASPARYARPAPRPRGVRSKYCPRSSRIRLPAGCPSR